MAIATEELDNGVTKIVLDGSLDIAGAMAIDLRMNVATAHSKAVLIDLEKVTFIGSMGLRCLVAPARALLNRGGKMVLLNPTANVAQVLQTSGIDTMIPVFHDLPAALAALA